MDQQVKIEIKRTELDHFLTRHILYKVTIVYLIIIIKNSCPWVEQNKYLIG